MEVRRAGLMDILKVFLMGLISVGTKEYESVGRSDYAMADEMEIYWV